jgi:type II secretory pathway pseudopilin PulG
MAFIIGAATLAVTAASAYASHQGQQQQAKKQNAYAAATDAAAREYRRDAVEYQLDVWQQTWRMPRKCWPTRAASSTSRPCGPPPPLAAVERNRDADAFTLAVRGIEETIAAPSRRPEHKPPGKPHGHSTLLVSGAWKGTASRP